MGSFFAKIVYHKKLHFRGLTEFWMKNLQNNGFSSRFPGSWKKVRGKQRAPLLFWNYTFVTEGFKEICYCVTVEDSDDIVARSTSIFLSGVLMSIESNPKIRHKKITWSQHFSIRVFVLKKGGDDIDMVLGETN